MWFHSCVALTYVVDSVLVCALALWLWRAVLRGGEWRDALVIGALLAVIGGVREQTVISVAPLVLFTFWRFERARVAKLAAAMLVAVALGLVWFVPMLWTSGGLATYLKMGRLHASFNSSATFLGGGWGALWRNVINVLGFCWNGLVFGGVVVMAALVRRTVWMTPEQKRTWDEPRTQQLAFLAIWVLPMMILGTIIGFTKQPGYALSYLPGWFVLTGALVASLGVNWQKFGIISIICVANLAAFTVWPPRWDGVFYGTAPTAREIARHDAQLLRTVASIRKLYSPKDVALLHAAEFYLWGLRHFQLYLPEYEQYQLTADPTILHPPGKPMWRVRDGNLECVDKVDLGGKRGAVLMLPPGKKIDIFAPYLSVDSAETPTEDANNLRFLPTQAVLWKR